MGKYCPATVSGIATVINRTPSVGIQVDHCSNANVLKITSMVIGSRRWQTLNALRSARATTSGAHFSFPALPRVLSDAATIVPSAERNYNAAAAQIR